MLGAIPAPTLRRANLSVDGDQASPQGSAEGSMVSSGGWSVLDACFTTTE